MPNPFLSATLPTKGSQASEDWISPDFQQRGVNLLLEMLSPLRAFFKEERDRETETGTERDLGLDSPSMHAGPKDVLENKVNMNMELKGSTILVNGFKPSQK